MFKKSKELIQLNKSLIKDIIKFDKQMFFLSVSRIIFSVVYPLIISIIPKIIIDSIENNIGIFNLVIKTLLISILVASISWINPCIHEKIATKSEKIRISYQLQLMKNLLNTNYETLVDRTKFEKAKIFVDGNSTAPSFEYSFALSDNIISIIGLISCVIILSGKNTILFFIFIASIVFEYYFNKKRFSNIRKMNDRMFLSNIKNDYIFRKGITTNFIRDAIIFDSVKKISEKLNTHTFDVINSLNKYNNINSKLELIKLVFIVIRDLVICIIVIKNIFSGTQKLSDFVLYFGLITVMTKWITTFYTSQSDLSYISSTYKDYKLFSKNYTLPSNTSLHTYNDLQKIEFKNVCYKYGDKTTLNNINITLQMNQRIAIIGKNGSGKSTLANIICGLFEPYSGEILINDEIVSFEKYSQIVKPNISVLFQKDNLLPEKLHSNISLKNTSNTPLLLKALEKTDMLKKVRSLKESINTNLNPTVHQHAPDFSGGETQRLLMSRCFYRNSEINLFDEPTASLDVKSENLVYKSIANDNTLSIVISHRIANIMNSDLIIVVDEGKIAEIGTHNKLIKNKGLYYEMFKIQEKIFKS